MIARPAVDSDVAAITLLQQVFDTYWFGAPENDESEVRDSFDRVEPLSDRSRLLFDGTRLLAAAWWWAPAETSLLVDPTVDTAPLYDDLLPWLRGSGARTVEALDRDLVLQQSLRRHGWEHQLSSYELIRAVDGWVLAQPSWPEGVRVTSLGPDDAAAVHRVVYEEAGWADVPGHGLRPFEEWRSLFLSAEVDPTQQVLAWRDGRLIGVALGKTFSDGSGWVAQLAVARDQQGQGLGRAVLLEALARRVAAGATQLGLGVSAANPTALRLYLDVGLVVVREWRRHKPGEAS